MDNIETEKQQLKFLKTNSLKNGIYLVAQNGRYLQTCN
jgi:hypothetical protein